MFNIVLGSRGCLCALGWGLWLAGRERTTTPEHRRDGRVQEVRLSCHASSY